MKITVRAVEEQDIPDAIRVMKEAWEYAHNTRGGDYPEEAHEFDMSLNTVERFTAVMEDEHGFFFIALVDGKIAGSIRGEMFGKSGFAMIRNIAIHPNHLRKGAGKALMEHAMDYLKAAGCHKVSLNTLQALIPAINLYLKMGFVPEAYLRKQWWGMDFIYMSKWL
ncbi:MAG: GNAT family N-acetyltransferase [Thermoplasmata archaeon]